MDRYENTLMLEAQADPTVLDLYDFEEAARERGGFLGIPQKLMRTQEKVDKLRDSRKEQQAKQQQQMQQQEMMSQAAPAMAKSMAA